ncbi:MAG: polysaccharide deacetylase family protein [Clostridia bacterium]|nr:polysaccharide deacetylase family protein [Clostridia bacterium]
MDKYLIINADDFGMCHAHNVATMELFKCGGITSSTIMAPCAWAKEAVQFAIDNPQYAIGVHLTTTSEWGNYRWAPVNKEKTATLRDEEGFMWHECDQFANAADLQEVCGEIVAQVEHLKNLGLNPSHLDNHMGSLYGVDTGRFELLVATIEIAGKYGLPFRMPTTFTDAQFSNDMLDIKVPREMIDSLIGQLVELGKAHKVAMPDFLLPGDWNGPQNDSYENFREYIYELYRTFEPGVTETYIHPAVECDEIKAITGCWHRRVWEYKLFSDPKTKQHIDSMGIKLINYKDLNKMRGY